MDTPKQVKKPLRLLPRAEVLRRLGDIGVSTLYAGMKEGRYPRPIKISPGRAAWDEEEIDHVVEEARALRNAKVTL